MPRFTTCLAVLLLLAAATHARAAEGFSAPAITAPVLRGAYHPDSTLVGGGCFYGGFASQLQAVLYERDLARAELALITRRVDSFRPFRSFGRYGATYFVEQGWQV